MAVAQKVSSTQARQWLLVAGACVVPGSVVLQQIERRVLQVWN
jgi:hypothetical protein